jgi:hypothetical protein
MRPLLPLAILLTTLSCTAAPVIEPAPERAAEARAALFAPGYCEPYISNNCTPPFADAMAICMRLYGEQWDELVSPVECWHDTPPPSWNCAPVCNQEIVCPGAEEWPSMLWCCPF